MRLNKLDQEIEDRCNALGVSSLGMLLAKHREREKQRRKRAKQRERWAVESPEEREKRRAKLRVKSRTSRDKREHKALTKATEAAWLNQGPLQGSVADLSQGQPA